MNRLDRLYEGHLTIREFSVAAGGEWASRLAGWSVIQVGRGTGYYLHPRLNQELETGSVLLVTGAVEASIRASQLGELSFYGFSVTPARLTGIITLVEQGILKAAAARKENAIKILPPDSPSALKMRELQTTPKRDGLLFRLKLLQLFAEIVGHELERTTPAEETTDAKQRLRVFLKEMPSSELLEMNFSELAQRTHCTSRHLGRIFHELVGMSFRDKRAAIRLERARELLATTDFKIVDVALESGFKSLSLFNLMFARHFGVSPGKWRQKQGALGENAGNEKNKNTLSGNRQLVSLQMKTPARSSQPDGRFPRKNDPGSNGATGMTRRTRQLATVS
jgi:AraC-like DNA-binding protein